MDIQLADRAFDKAHFLKGARAAYDMIQKAFAAGDRVALRPLVDEVFAAFEAEIAARGGASAATSLSAITDARITAAELHGDNAEITVAFRAQFAKDGTQADVGDIWTFSRRLGAADPNWVLVATSGEFAEGPAASLAVAAAAVLAACVAPQKRNGLAPDAGELRRSSRLAGRR